MNTEKLLAEFKEQQTKLMEEIRNLDAELSQKKEIYLKLQGAIEGVTLLAQESKSEEQSVEVLEEPSAE
jgi:uncharacterized protein YaaN involved in tellurite resistance